MRRKVAAFLLALSLFFTISVSETNANFEKDQAFAPSYTSYSGPGGPVEIVPPQG